jgi:hypothetical protein
MQVFNFGGSPLLAPPSPVTVSAQVQALNNPLIIYVKEACFFICMYSIVCMHVYPSSKLGIVSTLAVCSNSNIH